MPGPSTRRSRKASPGPTTDEAVRSSLRKGHRERSRELAHEAMESERALIIDLAEWLGIDERLVSRSLRGEAPLDWGDLLAFAASGRGGARLARRVMALLGSEIDRIEMGHSR